MTEKVALLLEDEGIIALDVEQSLAGEGYMVVTATSSSAALQWLADNPPPALAVIDVHLSDGPCVEVAVQLARDAVPFVVHTGSMASEHEVFTKGYWLPKPTSSARLLTAVQQAAGARAGASAPSIDLAPC